MSRRVSNWPAKLHDCVEAHRHTPFAWGRHDCILFACRGIEAITGTDPAAVWRGSYSSALGAARIWRAYGGFDAMIHTVAASHGFNQQSVKLARRGDLVLLPGKLPAAGICLGRVCAFAGHDGLVFRSPADCTNSWRID